MNIKDHFGLDIGTAEVKAVWLEEQNGVVKLLSGGLVKSPDLTDQRAVAETIKKLVSDLAVGTRNVVISLPEAHVVTRVIETPLLADEELDSAMKWEAEQYIPLPLDEVYLRHQVLSTPTQPGIDAKMEVLLVAAPNKMIDGYLSVLNLAGLEAVGIETEILAISRSLVSNDPYSPTTLILNFGGTTTDLSVVRKGNISFVRSISSGSEAITRAIVLGLGLDPMQAEEYKKTYGLDSSKLDGKVAAVIKPVMETIVAEIKKAIFYYQTKHPDDPVKRVVLAGGMARMAGLIEYLGGELALEVQIGNPL
ncbi:MAG: type IV pilus assembly protein PilM, partial [Patescibacteria group bacterium]